MNELDLLRDWPETDIHPSAEVRAHARDQLERAYSAAAVIPTQPTRVGRQFAKRFAIAALAAAVLIAGAIVWAQRQVDERIDRVKTVTLPNGVLDPGEVGARAGNILIVGSDRRDGSNVAAFGSPAETGPPRSDTIILLRFDHDGVRALWIPRDLAVATAPGSSINGTFNRGPQGLIDAIKTELDIEVNHYVEVDFSGFERIVNEVGGVKMSFPGPVRDAYSGLDIAAAGCQSLDGRTALAWVRSRHAELMENGIWNDLLSGRADLDRLSHQQEFIRALARQFRAHVDGDPAAAVRLVDTLIPLLKIDSGFSRTEIMGLVRALIGVDPASLQLATLPVEAAPDGAHVVPVQPAAEQVLAVFRGAPAPAAPSGPSVPATAPVHDC